MHSDRNKVLLIVDGSDQSFWMAQYASKVFTPAKTEITLFHVMNKVPETFWDWEEDPLNPLRLDYMKEWESQKQQQMKDFMEKVRKVFLEEGFPENSISVKIQERQTGVARDIIREAQNGYDVLLVGRKGLSTLEDNLLGSVAGKIVNKLTDVSVCLVGGNPKPGKFLVGMDCSQGALKAVDLMGRMIGDCNPAISLVHVLRIPDCGQGAMFSTEQMNKCVEDAEKAMGIVFEKACGILVNAGCSNARISSKTVKGASSRSAALIEEARRQDIGTIAVGRRGLSRIEEFQMGRVANKLAQIGGNMAIWIAN